MLGSPFHIKNIGRISFCFVVVSFCLSLFLTIANKFSIGAISGELPGHDNTCISLFNKCSFTFFEVWHGPNHVVKWILHSQMFPVAGAIFGGQLFQYNSPSSSFFRILVNVPDCHN